MRRRDRVYAWLRSHPLWVDTAIAIVLIPVALYSPEPFEPSWLHPVLGTAMCLVLSVRRVAPVATLVALTVLALVQWASGVPLSQIDLLLMFGLYSVAAYGSRRASRAALGIGLLGAVLAAQRYFTVEGASSFVYGFVALSAVVVAAWAMGDVRRIRHAYVTELMARAQQAERERDQRARIAVADERARIAREMHDVVAHNLSVMVVQADGGRYAADEHPEKAAKTLETIAATGRSALAEMRRLLGVLRAEHDATELGPQPGVARLPELIDSVRAAGLPVEADLVGDAERVPAGVSLAAYRAAQEALTNTLKYGGPTASAALSLVCAPDRVRLVVRDDGRGAAASDDGAGHGLIGMRERVAAYGGSVAAGPRPGGGWQVEVEIPYEMSERT